MARKPANMRYLADDVPPLAIVIVNALQYAAVTSSFLVFPLIIAREAHLTTAAADSMLSWAMLVLALGTSLQALPHGPIGSGYLAPSVMTAIFLGPSIAAVRIGGLALMSGMTIFSGAVQAVFSRSLNKLRTLLPPELAGVVIFLVGISNGVVGLRYLLAPDTGALPGLAHWIVAGVTLGVMVAANVWSRGVLGLSCALFGMLAGYIVAIPLGVLSYDKLAEVATLPVLAAPGIGQIGWSFDATLILPFVIAAIANGLKGAALLTASQRLLDADWVRPDLKPISRGVLADALTVMAAGTVSVFAVNVSASSVGLTAATGVASRRVAYATSAIFALLAFLPMFTQLLVLMPKPVVGATLVFTSCAILKNGMEAIAARIYDTRKTLVVGLSIMSGVGVEAFPATFQRMPALMHPITVSALVFGTAVGFVLNLCFRIGQRQTTTMTVEPVAPDVQALARFVETCGAAWGARRDVVLRAEHAVQELVESVAEYCKPHGPMRLSTSFDEFKLDLELAYTGIAFPTVKDRPTAEEIVDRDDGAHRLAAFLLQRYATGVSTSLRNGICTVRLHFDQ
ncbi:MAG: solute carrier family 23 protein [Rhodopila sp.]|nr:solute carrier family 23 protein [Rhodopila sp.]